MTLPLILALAASALAVLYGIVLIGWINKQPAGDERMRSIARAIQEGAQAYLSRQYKTIAVVALVVFVLLWIFIDGRGVPISGIGFLLGAVLSGAAGFIGM